MSFQILHFVHTKVLEEKYKKRRQVLRSICKNKKERSNFLYPKGFSTNIEPDVEFSVDKGDKNRKML